MPCRVKAGAPPVLARTRNISCGGALCELPQAVPAMTRLEVALELPAVAGQGAQTVLCEGVVLRQDQIRNGSSPCFLTAILFTALPPETRRRIAEFVLQSMLSHDHRRT